MGGGLIGSGHTIVDGEGTAMTQESNLQFIGANVSNDNTTQSTVITNALEVTQAEYDALVQAGEVLPDVDYYIEDAAPTAIDAAHLPYDSNISTKEKIDSFATVATSGSYNDLSNKPTIPSLQAVTLLSNQQLSITETAYNLSDDYTKYSIIIFSVSWLGGVPSKYEMCLNGVIADLQINLNGIYSNAHATIVRFPSNKTSIRAFASDANVYLNVYGLK